MVSKFLDIVMREEIDMDTPKVIRETVNFKASPVQKAYMAGLVERASEGRKGSVLRNVVNMLS